MAKFKITRNEDGTSRVTGRAMKNGKRVGGSESTNAKQADGDQWKLELLECARNVYAMIREPKD